MSKSKRKAPLGKLLAQLPGKLTELEMLVVSSSLLGASENFKRQLLLN